MAEMQRSTDQTEPNENKKRLSGVAAMKSGARKLTLGLGSSALVLITATAITLVAIASLAWLSKNRDLDSGSMAMDMTSELFELLAPDTLPSPTPEQAQKTRVDTATGTTYTIAASPNAYADSLLLTLQPENTEILRPGSYGTLEFYICVKNPNLASVVFNLSRYVTEVEDVALPADVPGYTRGHILLFESKTGDVYADLIDNGLTGGIQGTYTYTFSEHATEATTINGETCYPVAIEWVWPKNFNEMVAQTNGGILTWMTAHYDWIFRGDGMSPYMTTYSSNYGSSVPAEQAALRAAATELSKAYDRADQAIGDTVQDFIVEFTAYTGTSGA